MDLNLLRTISAFVMMARESIFDKQLCNPREMHFLTEIFTWYVITYDLFISLYVLGLLKYHISYLYSIAMKTLILVL